MTFDPDYPAYKAQLESEPMRNQFNALKQLIDAIPAGSGGGGPETDPVFAASEAAKLVAGDKARLDAVAAGNNVLRLDQRENRQQTVIGYPVFDTGFYVGPAAMPWLWFDAITPQTLGDPKFQDPVTVCEPVEDTHADTKGARNAAIEAALAGLLSAIPANCWAAPAPSTAAEALARLALAVTNKGAKPI